MTEHTPVKFAGSSGQPKRPLEEQILLPPLLEWLSTTRRLRVGSSVVNEFRWLGRKIDLVTVTPTGRLIAYELKLAHITRVTEQALYNRAAFDRSYIVTASQPRPENIQHAVTQGVGIIWINKGKVRVLIESPLVRAEKRIRSRLLTTLRNDR
jgi:hypothetical protein